ncbi:ABC transporter substrate-binding protein [Eubacteriales bacterium OttesenSCG-928-A19]|nr:ABC transporter substrate-binding protein [Eubacteriales bacterium OttesenSCG-928-A19]
MTKKIRILAVCVAVMLMLGAAPALAADTPVNLRIAWFGATVRNEATLAALDAYTAEFPHITFDPEFVGSNPEFSDKLATQAAAQNIPDIIIMDLAWLKDYASRGQLLELTDVDTSKINAAIVADGTYNGKFYAMPNSVASTAFVYNNARVEDLGLTTVPVNGWSWDDYYAFCEEAKAAVGEDTFVSADFSYSYTMYCAYQLSHGKGSPITVDGQINFDKDTWVEFQELFIDFRDRGIVPPPDISVTNKDGDVTLDPLLLGKVLIKNAFSSTFGSWDSVEADTYALVTMPRDVEASDYVKVSAFWSIAANTKYPAEAQHVVDWLVNSVSAGEALGFVRGSQVNSDVLAAITPDLSSTDQASAALVEFITPTAQPFTMMAEGWNSFYMTDYENICQEVMFGVSTPEQAYDAIINKAKEYVK